MKGIIFTARAPRMSIFRNVGANDGGGAHTCPAGLNRVIRFDRTTTSDFAMPAGRCGTVASIVEVVQPHGSGDGTFRIHVALADLPEGIRLRAGMSAELAIRAGATHLLQKLIGVLPRSYQEDDILFVHGSARNPLNEYIFPEDTYNRRKMEKIFALLRKHSFQGHTHVPGVFTEDFRFFSPEDIDHEYRLTDEKTMINVGSVGQPRDGDPRACYVLLTDDLVQFRRVEYAFEETIAQIHAVADLDDFLGDRLRNGQ